VGPICICCNKGHATAFVRIKTYQAMNAPCTFFAAGFAEAAAGSGSAADSFALPSDRDTRSSGSLRAAAAAAGGGSELQAAVVEAAMQLVLERGAAAAASLRGLLHTADLITVAAGNAHLLSA
jgi:hypothetical protein